MRSFSGDRNMWVFSTGRHTRTGLREVRSAVAALEFGILAPVMALLVIGVFDISKAAILWEQVWSASRTISESAATLAIQPDGSAQLTGAQANQALSAVFAEIPWLRAGIATSQETSTNAGGTASAVLTSVNYAVSQGCTTACSYVATVEWSKPYGYPGFITGSSVLRPCGPLSQGGPGLPRNPGSISLAPLASLPSDKITVPDPFLMADVQLTYTPFFYNVFLGKVTFAATSYWSVRSNIPGSTKTWATLSSTEPNDPSNPNDAHATTCS
jgi:Flp pilus assembly protein TadG